MKKTTYRLKDISYMNLSLTYIALIVGTTIITLVFVAVYSLEKRWLMMVVSAGLGGTIIFGVYSIGARYGQYGLVILLGKMLQPRQLKNDFPLIAKYFITTPPDEKSKGKKSE